MEVIQVAEDKAPVLTPGGTTNGLYRIVWINRKEKT
jgi:hypothetical protein